MLRALLVGLFLLLTTPVAAHALVRLQAQRGDPRGQRGHPRGQRGHPRGDPRGDPRDD